MHISSSRRGFLRGLAGAGLFAAGGCFSVTPRKPGEKIRLAAVGISGKGYSDWMPMLQSGQVEMVAFCDADANMLPRVLESAKRDAPGVDLSKVPFYTDYRKLFDDAQILGIDAMTISTPDHVHAPVAIQAMQLGIHVYVQKPLVRTLWENDYFHKTAKDVGVVVQMGNQGSALDSMRRCTEVLQSGILGDVTEVHVWTNRPVWPQGKAVEDYIKGRGSKGDAVRKGLNWDAWLATAADRPFLDKYPADAKVYDPWGIGKNVYHAFTWRGLKDFGAGAFGDMACHTMNLPFRGLELGAVTDAECIKIESSNNVAYPLRSIVKMTYAARTARFGSNKGAKLPAVTLYWYDGDWKPSADLMPKYAAKNGGKVPNTGCYIKGSKGDVLMQDDYGAKCAIALESDKEFIDVFQHEAAKAVGSWIPKIGKGGNIKTEKSTVAMKGFAIEHYAEFISAIRGEGPVYEQTNSRCFSDIEYCIPQMEGILVGCVAQQVPGKHVWNSCKQEFGDAAANALVKPYIRKGFEF